jgi:spermidine synthase
MTASLIFLLLVTGLSGIVAQTVLIRECLIIYGGNELSIGVTIGAWVVWEALGAFIGGRWPRGGRGAVHAFIAAGLIFGIVFPASIYAVRAFKVIAGLPPEISLGITSIFGASMVIFLPLSLLHGFAFTTACRVYESVKGPGGKAAGRVYFYEMVGTIAGGILVSYVLVSWLHSFRIAGLILVLMALACLMMAVSAATRGGKLLAALSLAVALGSAVFMAAGLDGRLQWRSIAAQWHGREVVSYENSLYQNIAVTRGTGQYTFFTDGLPAATIPVPDITRAEEIVHIPLLTHGTPRNVLVLHGGAGGVIGEVLKYPTVRRVDYVEIDPAYLGTLVRYPSVLVRSELGDPRVMLHYTDGRRFVKAASPDRRYDVVLLGVASPATLQANRFFTLEFFREVRGILTDEGILVFTVPGSLAYYDRELKDINMSAMATAGKVFPHVAVVPGDENIFLASPSAKDIDLSPQRLESRLRDLRLATRLISLPHLTYRLDRERMEWFRRAIEPSRAQVNRDLAPKGLYYTIAYINALHTPSMKGLFAAAGRRGVTVFLAALGLLAAGAFLLRGKHRRVSVLFAISTTGFVVMLLELSLIFVFQVAYGYVFHEIGMLITMLMAGMAAGSMAAARRVTTAGVSKAFVAAEASLASFCLLLFILLTLTGHGAGAGGLPGRLLFFALLFVPGFFAGMEFPLAVELFDGKERTGGSVGPVYAGDLAGGFIGGMLGGFFLFPLMGLAMGCLLFGALKAAGLLLLLLSGKRK